MKIIPKQVIKETIGIIIISSILGMSVNKFHPQGVKIANQRPPFEYIPDTVLAEDLPIANIQINKEDGTEEENLIEELRFINTKQVLQLIAKGNALLLDARSEEEYLSGHIPKAQNLPFENLSEYEELLKSLPKDKWLICYCEGHQCDIGELLAYELINSGYKLVAAYIDGINEWQKSGNIVQGKENDSRAN